MLKLSQNGDLEWIKLYGGTGANNFAKLMSDDDGGVLALGNTTGYG